MTGAYTAAERRQLESALRDGDPLRCPHCHVALSAQPVEKTPEVSYVRHRVWVLCPTCRRTASLDHPPGGGTGGWPPGGGPGSGDKGSGPSSGGESGGPGGGGMAGGPTDSGGTSSAGG